MAVRDIYVNSQLALHAPEVAIFAGGAAEKVLVSTFETLAADDDATVYRLFKGISSERRMLSAEVVNDAITSGTDYDFGGYKGLDDGGAVIDKDAFADGIDMSSARAVGSSVSLLTAYDQAEMGQMIYELLGDTEASRTFKVDLALTANTVGSAAGTITVVIHFA